MSPVAAPVMLAVAVALPFLVVPPLWDAVARRIGTSAQRRARRTLRRAWRGLAQ